MIHKKKKEDEEEDKKVVAPPVDRNLLPAADRKALLQDGGAQGRRKALRLQPDRPVPGRPRARSIGRRCAGLLPIVDSGVSLQPPIHPLTRAVHRLGQARENGLHCVAVGHGATAASRDRSSDALAHEHGVDAPRQLLLPYMSIRGHASGNQGRDRGREVLVLRVDQTGWRLLFRSSSTARRDSVSVLELQESAASRS